MSDYYSTLGLKKNASIDEIKKAYKSLAKKYHPDVSSEPDAEQKFKKIVEAYQVLSDSEKKQKYDAYGDDAFKQYQNYQGFGQDFSGFGNFEDLFGQFDFGFGGIDLNDIFGGSTKRRNANDIGQNIKLNLNLSFEEAVFGAEKQITYERIEKCSDCNGTGAEKSIEKTCDVCNGKGIELRQQRTPFGIFQSQTTCRKCKGKGKIPKETCSKCNGRGFQKNVVKSTIKVPAGINTGNHLRFGAKGNEGLDGVGDLIVVFFVEPHKIFKRDDEDIYIELPISFYEAVLGSTIEVPTLEGVENLKIPAGTQSGTIFRVKNKGIKILNSNEFGDEFVKVIIETPKKLNKKQKELLNQLKIEDEQKKKRKNFFKKLFENFK